MHNPAFNLHNLRIIMHIAFGTDLCCMQLYIIRKEGVRMHVWLYTVKIGVLWTNSWGIECMLPCVVKKFSSM